mgnify:CR=1 FL=1
MASSQAEQSTSPDVPSVIHVQKKFWETDRSYVLICATCGTYWPCEHERKRSPVQEERMCPCGNCNATWEQAVLDLIHGPAKLNRDQAENRLNQLL